MTPEEALELWKRPDLDCSRVRFQPFKPIEGEDGFLVGYLSTAGCTVSIPLMASELRGKSAESLLDYVNALLQCACLQLSAVIWAEEQKKAVV